MAIANFSPKLENFQGFEPTASAFSAVVIYQLSSEDPYVGLCWELLNFFFGIKFAIV